MSIVELLPAGPLGNQDDADALLELAFLMTAADGRLAEEEASAVRQLLVRLRGAASESDVTSLIARFKTDLAGGDIADRVRAVAPRLPADLKETAFKIAIGLALVDRDPSDRENELVGVLFEALALSEARADELAAEVRASFGART